MRNGNLTNFNRIIKAEPHEGYLIHLWFADGTDGEVDIARFLEHGFRGFLAPLKDLEFFRKVRVKRGDFTISWPGNLDLDMDMLWAEATGHPIIWSGEVVYTPHTRKLNPIPY